MISRPCTVCEFSNYVQTIFVKQRYDFVCFIIIVSVLLNVYRYLRALVRDSVFNFEILSPGPAIRKNYESRELRCPPNIDTYSFAFFVRFN